MIYLPINDNKRLEVTRMDKTTIAGITAIGIAALTLGDAHAGSYEAQARLDGIVTDVKVGTGFGSETKNLRVAARNRLLAQYDGDVDGITFFEESLGELGGFRAIGQARFFYGRTDDATTLTLYPQAGLFYSGGGDQFGVSVWVTSSTTENPIAELRIDPRYNTKSNKWYIPDRIDAELYVWTPTVEPWKVFKERARVNVGYQPMKGLLVGPAIEMEHEENDFIAQPGLFARAEL